MPRNRSERHSPEEAEAIAFLNTVDLLAMENFHSRYSPYHERFCSLSLAARRLLAKIPKNKRMTWLAWKLNPKAHPITTQDKNALIAFALDAETQNFRSRESAIDLFERRRTLPNRAYLEIFLIGQGNFALQCEHIFKTLGRELDAA